MSLDWPANSSNAIKILKRRRFPLIHCLMSLNNESMKWCEGLVELPTETFFFRKRKRLIWVFPFKRIAISDSIYRRCDVEVFAADFDERLLVA